MQDYIDRGDNLQDMNYLEFFLNTYEQEGTTVAAHDIYMRGPKLDKRSSYNLDVGQGT